MSDSGNQFDLIVVGLGAMGSAALYHAASSGLRVLGIDKFDPPHKMGSSHAETRITRLAIGEGQQYMPFVARSHQIWRDLEAQSGTDLFYQTGGYTIAPQGAKAGERWGDFVNVTAQIAADNNIEYEVLDPAELTARQPNLIVKPGWLAGYEPTAGVVLIEKAIAVQLNLARKQGAMTVTNQLVTAIEPGPSGVTIKAKAGSFAASKALITTGPWIGDLVPIAKAHVEVCRQTVVWFDVEDPEPFSTANFSYVMWPGHAIEDYGAIWPTPPGSIGLKVMRERFDQTCHPDEVDRTVSETEIAELYEGQVVGRVKGVKPDALRSEVCLYSVTEDEHFIIDYHPANSNVMFASACSGHGFKHSTALGEAMVAGLMGFGGAQSLDPFALERRVPVARSQDGRK